MAKLQNSTVVRSVIWSDFDVRRVNYVQSQIPDFVHMHV